MAERETKEETGAGRVIGITRESGKGGRGMVKVWVLMMHLSTWNNMIHAGAGGPVVIDNIASKEECERVGRYAWENLKGPDEKAFVCIEVWKRK